MTFLTKEDLDEYRKAETEFGKTKDRINSRVNQILNLIAKQFGKKVRNWYYPDAAQGEVGNFNINYDIDYVLDPSLNLDTHEWDYSNEFPVDFLTDTDDEIEKTVKKQIKDTKRRMVEEKKKKQERKERQSVGKKEALAKLTKEERKILGV